MNIAEQILLKLLGENNQDMTYVYFEEERLIIDSVITLTDEEQEYLKELTGQDFITSFATEEEMASGSFLQVLRDRVNDDRYTEGTVDDLFAAADELANEDDT